MPFKMDKIGGLCIECLRMLTVVREYSHLCKRLVCEFGGLVYCVMQVSTPSL